MWKIKTQALNIKPDDNLETCTCGSHRTLTCSLAHSVRAVSALDKKFVFVWGHTPSVGFLEAGDILREKKFHDVKINSLNGKPDHTCEQDHNYMWEIEEKKGTALFIYDKINNLSAKSDYTMETL